MLLQLKSYHMVVAEVGQPPPRRLFVSQPPEDTSQMRCSPVENKRTAKWRVVMEFYGIITRPQYRNIDIEAALWKVSYGRIRCKFFVNALMSLYKFDKKTGMDRFLHRLYRLFEGAERDAVDWRDLLCCLCILRQGRHVRCGPEHVLVSMFDMYADLTAMRAVARTDLERVVRVAALTDGEVELCGSVLESLVKEMCKEHGYNRVPDRISRKAFVDILTMSQRLAVVFKAQAWARLPEDLRLKVLALEEEASVVRYEVQDQKFLLRRAHQGFRRILQRRCFGAWATHAAHQHKARYARDVEMCKRLIRAVRWLQVYATALKAFRSKENAAEKVKHAFIQLKAMHRLHNWHSAVQAMKRIPSDAAKQYRKEVAEGVGHLRRCYDLLARRVAFTRWFEVVWALTAAETAQTHHRKQLVRRHLLALHTYVRETRSAQEVQDAEEKTRRDNQQLVMRALEEASERVRTQEEEKRRAQEAEREARREERARARAWEAQRRRAARQAHDRAKLAKQKEAQDARVRREKEEMRTAHEEEFRRRMDEELSKALELVESWFTRDEGGHLMATEAGQGVVQAEFKQLQETFFAPPKMDSTEAELTSIANITFAYIDAALRSRHQSLADLMKEFDEDGNGYLTHDELKQLFATLPLSLRQHQMQAIINTIDADGDGYVDLGELTAASVHALSMLGVADSPWKCYVDPAQSVLCYHNLATDEKVYDYKMTDEKLMEVLFENLKARDAQRARDMVTQEEPIAWRRKSEDYAARMIQRAYRGHLRWERMVKAESWKLQLARDKERVKMEERARGTIGRLILRFMARKELKYLARITWQKMVDGSTWAFYYFNHGTRESTYTKPPLLRRRDEDVVPPWTVQLREDRTETSVTSDEKPEGWRMCQMCRYYLAYRQCQGKGCDGYRFCFSCFRAHHLPQSCHCSRGGHDGVLIVEPVMCSRCEHTVASRECADCAMSYCKACHLRTHRNPRLAQHNWAQLQ